MRFSTIGLVVSSIVAVGLLAFTASRANMIVGTGVSTGITFNSAADLGNITGTSLTTSYTVGSGTNRLLVVAVMGDVLTGNGDCGAATYNGVSMNARSNNPTEGNGDNRFLNWFDLLAPASGAHNVVVTCSTSHFIGALAADYANVTAFDATGQASTPATVGAASLTTPITVVSSSGTWVMTAIQADNTSTTSFTNAGSPTVTATMRVIDSAFHILAIMDSNGVVTAGSQTTILQKTGGGTIGYLGLSNSYHQ